MEVPLLENLDKLALGVTRETLHGPLPIQTSMQLASDVLVACEIARGFKQERDMLSREVRRTMLLSSLL